MRFAPLVLVLIGVAAASEPVILGQGDHRYRVVDEWAKLPDGVRLGYTHGVAVTRDGDVVVFSDGPNPVLVFAPDGALRRWWGAELQPGAHGLTLVEEEGREVLYLAVEAQHRVVKATLAGEVLWSLGWPQEAKVYQSADQYRPTWVAVAPDGGFYITDGYGQGFIHQYRADRTWVRTFGGAGDEPGRMRTPHGVIVDAARSPAALLVADRESHRVQVLSLAGESRAVIPAAAPADGGQPLRRPCSFAFSGDDLVVADLCGRVTVLDRATGAVRAQLGEECEIWTRAGWPNLPPGDWRPGSFIAPHGVAADARGNLFVVEWTATGRITKLERLRDR